MIRRTAALQESRRFGVRQIPLLRPLGWLARGGSDLMRCPLPGVIHGAASTLFGALLILLAREHFWLLAGAFSGFLIVAPLVATGLYNISRALERGRPAGLKSALAAWRPDDKRLIGFGLLLALAGTGWVLTSAALITAFAPAPVNKPADFLRVVVLAPEGWLFEAWMVLGAVLTSWRVVIEHPLPMAIWAGLLMLLTLLGMATALAGLVVVAPWLAHASWHAYRDLVDASGLTSQPTRAWR